MSYEGIRFQLLDLPAVSPEHPVPWLASALQTADACLLVTDLTQPAGPDEMAALHAVLRERRVTLTPHWESAGASAGAAAEGAENPFALRLPTLLVANKADRLGDAAGELARSSSSRGCAIQPSSCRRPRGTASARSAPGSSLISASCGSTPSCRATRRPRSALRPSTRPDRGGRRAARAQRPRALAAVRARLGHLGFDGQQVGSEHPRADGDVVELHA